MQNINATYITEIEKILELPNITEVKINSSCELEELETNNDKMYLPQFLQEIAQTQSNSIITANIYYGEDNEIEIPVNKDDNGKLYVILDNKVSENKPAGDLSTSLIKREAGIKDYSHIFLTHGGVLDRFDSTLFIAPVVYAMLFVLEKL